MFGVLNNKLRLSGSDVVLPVSKLALGTASAAGQFTIAQSDTSTLSGISIVGPDGHQFGMNYNGAGLTVTEAGTTRMIFQAGGNIGVGVSSASAGFHIGNDLRVDGNFTVNGSLTTINTNATLTHMMNISNAGTGPALIVRQTGAQPVIDIYDDTTLAIRVADGGYLGINNAAPTEWLDVVGNIQSTGSLKSAYTLVTGPAATLTAAMPNISPGALLGWNRNGTGAVCIANQKGSFSGGWEFVSYNADASYRQVSMMLDDAGNVQVVGTGSILGNMYVAGNSSLSGTVVTLSNFNRTGPRNSLGGPHENIYTTSDPYPVYQKLMWGHDNISIGFDTYFNGSQWLCADTSTAFQIMKLSGNFLIRPSASVNTPGGTISWSTAGLLMDSNGRIGVNKTPACMLDIGGDASVASNITIGGTASAGLLIASACTVIGSITSGNLSTVNFNASGQSSISGSLFVGSSLTSTAIYTGTISSAVLSVSGPSSLSTLSVAGSLLASNVSVGGGMNVASNTTIGGTVVASFCAISGPATLGSLSTANLNVSGGANISGNLTVSTLSSTSISAAAVVSTYLNVSGMSSLSGNVTIASGTLAAPMMSISQHADFGGLITNNIFGSLLLRCYDESVSYANTTPVPGTALPAAFLTKPISQFQLSSLNMSAFNTGAQSINYSARISGYIQPPGTGTFTFRTTYQDGATIWLSATKLLDTWTFQGSTTQTISSTIILRQNMWLPLSVEHAVAGGPEKLLVEWNLDGGSYTTLAHAMDGSNFRFAYDMYEIEPALFKTSYFAGRAIFNDTAYLSAGASFPNALNFTGNISELANDAGYIASSRPTLTSLSVTNYGSVSGTLTAAVVGVNQAAPQFTLDVGGNINFTGSLFKGGNAYISSQWYNAGSNIYFTGGNVGVNTSSPQATLDVAGSLIATSLGITGAASISGVFTNRAFGSLLMRVFDDSGLYALSTLTPGTPLPPACMSRTYSDTQLTMINFLNQGFGSLSAYSLRIAGHIMAPQTGTYLFRTTTTDGASLFIYSQKITENWLYTGTTTQSVGTLTMYQNMWTPIIIEHAASSTISEQLLLEWSNNAGTTYNILAHGTISSSFRFGYDSAELPRTSFGSIFVGGKGNFSDISTFNKGLSLPNASGFTGNLSQLTNDAGYITGSSAAGTITGTFLNISQSATVAGNLSVGGVLGNNVSGQLTMRVFDDSGLYALGTRTAGAPLCAPFTSRPFTEQQIGSLSFSNATFGSLTAYSLKITGYIQPPSTGTYLIRSSYKDGLSLYISQQKLVDSWTYSASMTQSIGTLTLYQNIWYAFAAEHAAASSAAQALLIEWSQPGGTYTTMTNMTFSFAYDMKETPPSLFGTSYTYGHATFKDVAYLAGGVSLPNASFFSGNTSELSNDAGFVKSTGTVTTAGISFTGTAAGTLIQYINNVATISGSSTTLAYAAIGVSPGTALDTYALTSHRWWTGSSGTTSGSITMQLGAGSLTVPGNVVIGGLIRNSISGSLTARIYDDSALYAATTLTSGSALFPPFTSRPFSELQLSSVNISNLFAGTLSALSLRINGFIQPPTTGTYLFRSSWRDGISLYINQTKLVDSWTYAGSILQSVGTVIMFQNTWYDFTVEHAAVSTAAESLLVEYSVAGGSFATLNNNAFGFAYDMKETHAAQFGTSYTYGHASFQDVVYLNGGCALPNANSFTGRLSELTNDPGFLKTTNNATLTASALQLSSSPGPSLTFTSTSSGTLIQLINNVATISGSVTTLAFAGLGVTAGTALERFSSHGHRWWTGSSGTSSGSLSMQLVSTNLTVMGNLAVAGSITQSGNQLYYVSYLAASNNFSFTANGFQVPKSFWSYVASPYSNGDLMATDGTITFPASGVYTMTYSLQIFSSAGSNISTWIQTSTSSSPYYPNSTRLAFYQVASSSGQTTNCSGTYTGFFQSGDKIFLFAFAPTSPSFTGGGIVNYVSITGRTQ